MNEPRIPGIKEGREAEFLAKKTIEENHDRQMQAAGLWLARLVIGFLALVFIAMALGVIGLARKVFGF